MDKKWILILLLISILTIGSVSASENQTDELTLEDDDAIVDEEILASADEDVLTDDDIGTFTDLQDKIGYSSGSYKTITLLKDYAFNSEKDEKYKNGVAISNTYGITINGNGHTISGSNLARIFMLSTPGVTIKNVRFVDAYASGDGIKGYGGAIYADPEIYDVKIINSTFINNKASYGGAVYFKYENWDPANFEIIDSIFINNRASYGGAIYCNSIGSFTINNSTFTDNSANSGGSVWLRTPEKLTITNSKFDNDGRSIYLNSGNSENYADITFSHNILSENDYVYVANGKIGFNVQIIVLDNKTIFATEFNTLTAIITDLEGNRIALGNDYAGILRFKINDDGKIDAVQSTDGIWTAEYPIVEEGNYIISASHDDFSSIKVLDGNIIISDEIPKKDVALSVEVSEIDVGEIADIKISFDETVTGNITVFVGDVKQVYTLDGNENHVVLSVSGLNEGLYDVNVTYSGDDYYLNKEFLSKLKVNSKETDVNLPGVNVTENNSINANSIVNQTYSDLNQSAVSVISIKSNDLKVFYNSGEYYKVRILDNKKPVSSARVTIVFNGKKTIVVTDKNGWVKIKVSTSAVKPKVYNVSVTYGGVKVTNKITVKSLINAKKTTKVKRSAKSFKVKITLKGKSVVKKQSVKVKFRGKTYNFKTNSKGVVTFKVAKKVIKKLKRGKTYSFTITFNKDVVKRYVKVK